MVGLRSEEREESGEAEESKMSSLQTGGESCHRTNGSWSMCNTLARIPLIRFFRGEPSEQCEMLKSKSKLQTAKVLTRPCPPRGRGH